MNPDHTEILLKAKRKKQIDALRSITSRSVFFYRFNASIVSGLNAAGTGAVAGSLYAVKMILSHDSQ
jgi:hypothetical protein